MFSKEDIDTIVSRAFDEPVDVLDHHLNSHSDEKVGFLGNHQNLAIKIIRKSSSSKQPETHRFFVKSFPLVSKEQTKFIKENRIFDQEALYFNDLLPALKANCVAEDWCPKCLLANDRVLVLEDMRLKGYLMRDGKIFEGEYLKTALRTQARLHAASLLTEAKLGKSLNDLYPDACVEQIFTDKLIENKRIELTADLSERLAREQGRDYRRIYSGFRKAFDRIYHADDSKLKRVVNHGDSWPNNYLFDLPKCMLVDFQLVRYAPRMYDVAQLMYLSTTRDIRDREERAAIEAYHEELCDVLQRNNPEVERPSLQQLLDEYEELRGTALFIATMYYPIICLNKKVLAKYENDEERLYKEIMFRTGNDYIMELCEQDAEYKDRLVEIVLETVEYFERMAVPTEYKNGVKK